MVVSGCVGPRGDGYDPGQVMTAAEAETYHAHQIGAFVEAGADMVTAITMTNASEAIGVAKAAVKAQFPSPSRSRSRPMAVCRPAKRCRTRSARSMLQRRPHPLTT